ncbi:hypothetical protein BDW62DRAFT_63939 [Aspergillus aurantiobrunneus]
MSAPDSSLDDIFGSSPPRPEQSIPHPHSHLTVEPSELPSLRRQHVTAGYRDGISASKADHVQHGFDAGFPVGAQLGMRAGTILGIIEGVLRGYENNPASTVKKAGQRPPSSTTAPTPTPEADEARQAKHEELLRLYRQALKELDVQAVFAGVDGGELTEKEEKAEAQLSRKGDAVLAMWEERVSVAAWEENTMDALEAKSDDGKPDSERRKGVVNNGTAGQS